MELNESEEGPLLLLAEDDKDIAELFALAFKRMRPLWRFIHAENGVSAVEHMMKNGTPQAIVTDLKMPQMDGFQLIAWIRANDLFSSVPIIVSSSSVGADSVQKCFELGADDFIPKDCDPERLAKLFDRLAELVKIGFVSRKNPGQRTVGEKSYSQ